MSSYVAVDECPTPVIGLEWTEMYSYFGEVVGQFKDKFIIEDTSNGVYMLTTEEFVKKFSYGTIPGCWVRFKFPKDGGQ